MKKYNRSIILLALLFLCFGCSEFDDINNNPDSPTEVTAPLLATSLIGDLMKASSAKTFSGPQMVAKYMAWSESAQDEQYNKFGRIGFGGYTSLINCEKMLNYAGATEADAYKGLSLFLKAYKLYYISMNVGDIPYTEALQGQHGSLMPAYDTQKDVFLNILNDLDASYASFSKATTKFRGDIVYGGDIELWKKAVTAFQLKVLLSLSIKETDPDLKVKERFAKLVSERALFASNAENMQLVFKNQGGMIYPFHHTETKHAPYVMLSTVLVDSLKKYEDYRLFYYAKPAEAQIKAGIPANSWEAYLGTDPSLPFSEISTQNSEGKYCPLNPRYTNYEPGEPFFRLGYTEQNFILAEAALRGWINKTQASSYYLKGIEAALNFVKDNTPDNPEYNNGNAITSNYIQKHLAKPKLQLTGSFDTDLNKIITQKYLSAFMQTPNDPYYDYRRTGYPKLPIDVNTNQNTIPNKIPVRYMYPSNESARNRRNLEEALKRQFNGNDDVNELMWILKK